MRGPPEFQEVLLRRNKRSNSQFQLKPHRNKSLLYLEILEREEIFCEIGQRLSRVL